jgi:hypothetical protein
MNMRGPGMIGLVLAAGVVGAIAARGWGQAVSQPEPSPDRPAYQYVGVEQTIARIDGATGRIEILSQRSTPRSSLLTQQSRPWEWREIRVRDRNEATEPRRAPERRPDSGAAPDEDSEKTTVE